MGKISQQANNNDKHKGIPQQTYSTTPQKYQNDDQMMPSTTSTTKSNKICIKFLINLLIYVICILSLSISLYLSYRHQQLENNVKNLIYLEHKVMRIENDLDELIHKTNRLYSSTTSTINQQQNTAVDDDEPTMRRDSIIIGDNVELDASRNDDSIIVNKLPVHVFSEITRLKRDVSNLKMARRQRQTAVQQSPNENCLCPPGESFFPCFFYVDVIFPTVIHVIHTFEL